MIYSLDNPIKCEVIFVIIDLPPKVYYQNKNNSQLINFLDGTSIPFEYDGVLPCIAVRRPTKYEVENCEIIALTSKLYWCPYVK